MEAAAPPPVDALALALLAIRGDPADVHTVTIAEGRIAAHEGEPPGHAADELAAVGLRHLNELVFNNVRHKLEAYNRGVIPAVTGAMVTHRHHKDVVVHGCTVLKTITFKADPIRDAAAGEGVIASVVDALRHSSVVEEEAASVAVAEAALTALCAICANHEGNTAAARELVAHEPIGAVMARHPAAPTIAQRGVFALALLQ